MAFSYRFVVRDLGPCCSKSIKERLLREVTPVNSVNIEQNDVTVSTTESTFNPAIAAQIEQIFRDRSYEAKLQNPPSSIAAVNSAEKSLPHWLQGLLGLGAGLVVLLLCLLGGGLPFAVMAAMGAVSSLLTLFLGFRAFQRAWPAFRQDRELTMDTLFLASICLVLGLSIAALFFPFLPMMFEVGLLIFGFREVGLAIKAFLDHKIKEEVTLASRVPLEIEEWRDGEWHLTALTAIRVGARIRVQPGQRIPLDGKRLSTGKCEVDEEWICGSKGDGKVGFLAGVLLLPGSAPLELEVEREVMDSQLAQMDALVQEALKEKDKEEKEADIKKMTGRMLTYFVPIVFICALLAGLLVGFLVSPLVGLSCAISVLVCACPCVLGLIIPVSLRIGVGKAQRHGLWLMDAQALEDAQAVDTVVFDLHGTLTKGEQTVQPPEWRTTDPAVQTECLDVMYAIESAGWALAQQHQQRLKNQRESLKEDEDDLELAVTPSQPICNAIMRYVESVREKPQDDPTLSVDMLPGGLTMQKDGHIWQLGDERVLARQGINVELGELALGETRVFLVRDHQLMATMVLMDPLRDDALETVQQLRLQHITVCICTGEKKREVVEKYAKALGFDLQLDADNIHSGCLPRDKKNLIAALKKNGKHVAAVVDGVNDMVMVSAALGIAMLATADPSTRDKASIHIPGKLLKPLQFLVPIAKQTYRLIYFNLIASLTYNLVSLLLAGGVLLALGVVLSPVIGAALMVLQVALLFLITYAIHKKEVTLVFDPKSAKEAEEAVEPDSTQVMSRLIYSDQSPLPRAKRLLESYVQHGGGLGRGLAAMEFSPSPTLTAIKLRKCY